MSGDLTAAIRERLDDMEDSALSIADLDHPCMALRAGIAALRAVLDLHDNTMAMTLYGEFTNYACSHCVKASPCDTVRAIAGALGVVP